MLQNQTNSCDCDSNEYSLLTANTGIVLLSTANRSLDGSGPTGTVITAGADGTLIKKITIKAIMQTTIGLVQHFIFGESFCNSPSIDNYLS